MVPEGIIRNNNIIFSSKWKFFKKIKLLPIYISWNIEYTIKQWKLE